MKNFSIKFLTFVILIFGKNCLASSVDQIDNKAYLRWNLIFNKDELVISTNKNVLSIKSLQPEVLNSILNDLKTIPFKENYFSTSSHQDLRIEGSEIKIPLRDHSVEVFNFYQNEAKKYVIDFWINQDLVPKKEVTFVEPAPEKPSFEPVKKVETPKTPQIVATVKAPKKVEAPKPYRDFRYGASFIWDYDPMVPTLEKDIDTKIKAPEFLYKIKDRPYLSDAKEEHLQLTINFFNKREWGLMTKSIDLFEKKYGKSLYYDLNNFMRANALIMDNIDVQNKGIKLQALSLLENISEKTKDVALKIAILRYITQFYVDQSDFIKSLESAKKLYVEASEKFEDEISKIAINTILYSLAKLHESEKIKEFLENKTVKRLVSKQLGISYLYYIYLSNGKTLEIIRDFEKNKDSLAKPVEPALLFNVAESYFREAKYNEAISEFDNFIQNYSKLYKNSEARNRLALSYDLLNKDISKTLLLYKDVVNFSSDPASVYEAKLRIVGITLARKKEITKEDREYLSFFDKTPAEEKNLNKNLLKLLWQTKLRVKINNKEYEEALAFLQLIPLDTFSSVEKKVFEGDGAEAVLGRILQAYKENDFSRAVKTWEVFKTKYDANVGTNPYVHYIVSESFIKLGLIDSFNRAILDLKNLKNKNKRTFPIWVKTNSKYTIDSLVQELMLSKEVKSENWAGAELALKEIESKKLEKVNYNFYKGLISFKLLRYTDSVASFESVFLSKKEVAQLSAEQTIEMLSSYAESLYQLSDTEKFRKNTAAILKDLERFKTKDIQGVKERLNYILIESYAQDKKVNYTRIEELAKDFSKQFKDSSYRDRVQYLYGVSLIKSDNKKGEEILKELVSAEGTPSYLKDMARSELATIEIGKKRL